jgi:hypothetical protein
MAIQQHSGQWIKSICHVVSVKEEGALFALSLFMKKGEFWKKLVLYEAGQQNQENLDV